MSDLEILFEDNHIIAVNKKPGDIVQGDKTRDKPLPDFVKDYIKEKYQKPGEVFLGVTHRIDRPVSGVVLFARTSKALERLNEMFREKKIQKTYWAVVKNEPPKDSDTLIHFLRKNEKQNKSYTYDKEVQDSQRAELDYKILLQSDTYFLLEVHLHTGRHHQIRAQLSAIGSPIKGDVKYGFDRTNSNASIHLHSRKTEFIHPVNKQEIKIVAPVPDEKLWKYFQQKIEEQSS